MKYLYIAFGVLLTVGKPVYSQQSLSLKTAIQTALKNNLDIQLADNALAIAGITNSKSFTGELPTVTGTITDNEQISSTSQRFANPNNNIDRSNIASNNFAANITGSILLYNGKRVFATQKRLAALQQQSRFLLNAQVQNCIAQVVTKYFEVVRQQRYAATLVQSQQVAQQKLSIVETRKSVGMANDADILQAKIDLNALEQQLQNQALSIQQAMIDLYTAMAITAIPEKNTVLTDTIALRQPISIDSIKNELAKNPQLSAAATQININEAIEKETAALRYPTLRATTGYSFSNNQAAAGFNLLTRNYGPFVGLNLSIPIYSGQAAKKQQQIAAINTQTAKLQQQNLTLNYLNAVQKWHAQYAAALQQLTIQQKNYRLSEQLLQLIQEKFKLQQATIIDVKQAQQSFENESYRLINLQYAAKTAETNLLQLTCRLSAE